jgi:hypothetical protein
MGALPRVDTERGVVWAHCVFDQGTVNQGVLSERNRTQLSRLHSSEQHPRNRGVPHRAREIRRVEMIEPSATYHMNSPWPGGLSGD